MLVRQAVILVGGLGTRLGERTKDTPKPMLPVGGRPFLDTLIDEKDKNPQDDLMSRLVVEQLRPGLLSRKDVIEMARLLLIAGHDTTANMVATSVLALLLHEDQVALVRKDFTDAELSKAVDELFRYVNITHSGRRRVATADVMLGDQLIRAGEGVICKPTARVDARAEPSHPAAAGQFGNDLATTDVGHI